MKKTKVVMNVQELLKNIEQKNIGVLTTLTDEEIQTLTGDEIDRTQALDLCKVLPIPDDNIETLRKRIKSEYQNKKWLTCLICTTVLFEYDTSLVFRRIFCSCIEMLGFFEASLHFTKKILLNLKCEERDYIFAHQLCLKTYNYEEATSLLELALRRYGKTHSILSASSMQFRKQNIFDKFVRTNLDLTRCFPDSAAGYQNLAIASKQTGKYQESARYLKKALEIDPNNQNALFEYFSLDIPHGKSECNMLMEKCDNLKSSKKKYDYDNHFTFFSAYTYLHRQGEHQEAFDALVDGNKCLSTKLKYSRSLSEHQFQEIGNLMLSCINPIEEKWSQPIPIFIVGMPRSGTSLLAECLGCHSSISNCGELMYLNEAMARRGISDPIDQSDLISLRKYFYKRLKSEFTIDTKYFIDKMPTNFRWIKLLRAVFPSSIILHITRDKEATCWSIFKSRFTASGLSFSCDINNTNHFFQQYQKYMAPLLQEVDHNIHYEKLITDLEGHLSNILSFMRLKWEPSILKFFETEKPIVTASSQQIRMGLFTTPNKEFKKYKPIIKRNFGKFQP